MKALIIEDESRAISALKAEIKRHCPQIEIVDTAKTVMSGIKKIRETKPDLIFLDIQLTDGLGFEILEATNSIDFKIIFTTAYSQYAIKAIKFSALDYLLKPIDAEELKLAVKKASLSSKKEIYQKMENFIQNQQSQNQQKRIALQTHEGYFLHELNTITRCNSEGNYTSIYFNNGKRLLVAKTLKEYEQLLTGYGFERIHNSHIINLNYLVSYINKDGGYVVMKDKTTLPVSQRKKGQLLKILEALK